MSSDFSFSKILRILLIIIRPKNPKLGQFLGYPASYIYTANLPNCCKTVFTRTELRHTPRYSIHSSPICPYFQMTIFKAKNIFLVFGMGHTMNKLTNEYKKMQNFKNLVDLQCKCVKLDTPRIGPILGFSAVK